METYRSTTLSCRRQQQFVLVAQLLSAICNAFTAKALLPNSPASSQPSEEWLVRQLAACRPSLENRKGAERQIRPKWPLRWLLGKTWLRGCGWLDGRLGCGLAGCRPTGGNTFLPIFSLSHPSRASADTFRPKLWHFGYKNRLILTEKFHIWRVALLIRCEITCSCC